jgi:predicted nucleic acid-binding protein
MKTKNKAQDAARYRFQSGEQILVDANIWFYLFPPTAQPVPRWATVYSGAFSRLLHAKATPIVDGLVLSEYLNRYVRLEYDAFWRSSYPKYKDFRKSADGINVLQDAVAEMRQILKTSAPHDTPLASMDIAAVLGEVQNGSLDFNDGLLIQTCRLNGWKLLTHDHDMTIGGIELLTTNRKLLQACP